MSALLEARGLAVDYRARGRSRRVLEDVDLTLAPGEALGIVGESGSGKSTLARALLGLVPLAAGEVRLAGERLATLEARARRALLGQVGVVFQDPVGSLDPRLSAGESIAEPLEVHRPALGRAARTAQVASLLEAVGLDRALAARYPHELSGGQCQRVALARAMALAPRLLVCDEALSALDVSAQLQILVLLERFRSEQGTALLFISHNLAVVRRLCERVLVLYRGRVVEAGPSAALFATPAHPYTRLLVDAVPVPGRPPVAVPPETLAEAATGCPYAPRCPRAVPACAVAPPVLAATEPGRAVACLRPLPDATCRD